MRSLVAVCMCVVWASGCATSGAQEPAPAKETAPAKQDAAPTKDAAAAEAPADGWTSFGAPVDASTVVPAATLLADPKSYVGQSLVVSGRVADVCTKAGCWMVIAEGEETMRIRMKDHAFAVAKDGAGSDCRVQGEVVEIQVDPATVAHFESESRKPEMMPEKPGKSVVYEMVAAGVEFKPSASM